MLLPWRSCQVIFPKKGYAMIDTTVSTRRYQIMRFLEKSVERALIDLGPAANLQELYSRKEEFDQYILKGIRQFSVVSQRLSFYLNSEVGGKSKNELLSEFSYSGYSVSSLAREVMGHAAWKRGVRQRVNFVRASVREIGFERHPTTSELWDRVKNIGALCEPCDGPAVCLAIKDRPSGYVWIAMKQIPDAAGRRCIFRIDSNSLGQSLAAQRVESRDEWCLGAEIVFRRSE